MAGPSNPRPEDRVKGHNARWPRTILAGGVILFVVGIAIAAILLNRDSGDGPIAVDPAITNQQNYHEAQYAAGVSSGWPQTENDQHVGNYLESSWHDPASVYTTFTIDSREKGSGVPMADAELALVQVQSLPHYRERGRRWIRLRGKPAVRWAYDVAGEAHLDYFFEECDTGFIVRGTTPPGTWEALAPFFRGMATVITANCE
jgi:hypothetical protein